MFCGKCGRPIPDGQERCEFCDPVSSKAKQRRADVDMEDWGNDSGFASFGQNDDASSFEVNRPTRNAKSKKAKKAKGGKGKKPVLIAVAALLVVVIALTLVFWGKISRFYQRNFGDPTAYLQSVEKDNAAAAAGDFATTYNQLLSDYSIENPSADYALTLEVSDSLVALLETALANEGMDMDLSWVNSISLTPHMEMYENVLRYDIGVGLNGTTLLTVSVIWDVENNSIYIGVPELHDTYIAVSTYDMFGYGTEDVPEIFAMAQALNQALVDALPDSAEMQDLIVKYAGIIIDSFSDAEKEKRSVEIDGLEQDLLVVSVDLSQKDILKLVIDVLEEAKDDSLIEDVLLDLDAALTPYYGSSLGLYDSFRYGLEDALVSLEDGLDDVNNRTALTIDTYLDNKDNVVGRTFTLKAAGNEQSFSYITVTDDDRWAFEAEMAELYISGEGTVDGDARSGSYTVCVSGTDYLTIALDDCVTSGDAFTGTIRIIPESIVYDMAGLSGPYSSLLNQAALALTFTDNSCILGIETAGTTFVSITLSGDITEAQPIAIPPCFDVNDDSAGTKWLSELDLNALLTSLNNAGLPSTYMDAVEQLVDMFGDQF